MTYARHMIGCCDMCAVISVLLREIKSLIKRN